MIAAIVSGGASSLTELALPRNRVTDCGATALAAHLQSRPGIIDLDLGSNAIADRCRRISLSLRWSRRAMRMPAAVSKTWIILRAL